MTTVAITARRQARDARLARLGFTSYDAYLASAAWAAVKRRYRQSGASTICLCGATDVQYHHLTYDRVGGDELITDLQPLCGPCHTTVHALERQGLTDLKLTGLAYDEQRAAEHHATRADDATRRAAEHAAARAAFDALPIDERYRRLHAFNEKWNGPLRRLLRDYQQSAKRDRRATMGRIVERAVDTLLVVFPDALDELAP